MSKIDIQKLKLLYIDQGLNMVKTAAELGVSPPTVRCHLIKLGIPTRGLEIVPFEDIRRLYVDEQWSLRMIAEKFGISHQAVTRRLRARGVVTRPSGGFSNPRRLRQFDLVKESVDVEELVRSYQDEKVPINRLEKRFDLSYFMLRRILTSEGIRIRKHGEIQSQSYAPTLALAIGETVTIHIPDTKFPVQGLHGFARQRNLLIKVRTIGGNLFCVTRIG